MAEKKKTPATAPAAAEKVENRFSKAQRVASGRFRERKDILEALLDDGDLYTVRAVEGMIESYMKGEVV